MRLIYPIPNRNAIDDSMKISQSNQSLCPRSVNIFFMYDKMLSMPFWFESFGTDVYSNVPIRTVAAIVSSDTSFSSSRPDF